MTPGLSVERPEDAIAIIPLVESDFAAWAAARPEHERRWLAATGFDARTGTLCLLPGSSHGLAAVVAGVKDEPGPWALASLPAQLPDGHYYVDADDWTAEQHARAALGWALSCYRFDRYRAAEPCGAVLCLDGTCDGEAVANGARAVRLVRDLVNTPASDLTPERLGDAIAEMARDMGAEVGRTAGDSLLEGGFPAIHAVGRASDNRPELVDVRWGDPAAPKLTLVGKGVCFDTGGLDLKSAANMRLMKKDMGGAAHAAGLARMVMGAKLPVRLRLLVSAVENSVSGNAYRPGDVLDTRKGSTIEVDNTDAEGRIVLSDALTLASEESPDLVIDFATLTGAARVALGTELPVMFANRDTIADAILAAGVEQGDPVWRLPLHPPYRELIESRVADIVNSTGTPYGGAITAALFLEHFVPDDVQWVHFDIMAWNLKSRPGRPEGGEAMGLRAVFEFLRRRYG